MKKIPKFWIDELHGIIAQSQSKSGAWMLIRNKCHESNIEVPTMDKIKLYNDNRHNI